MVQKLNTHYYDGKLGGKYNKLKTSVKDEIIPDLTTTIREITELINQSRCLNKGQRKIALWILGKLAEKNGNWDQANQIHVHELLPLVWTRVRRDYDDSGKALFLEQLVDIRGGLCPQGRTTRLLQIIEDEVPQAVKEKAEKELKEEKIEKQEEEQEKKQEENDKSK